MPFNFGEETINSGDPASLTCLVHKGDLPVKIIWFHNNKSLDLNGYNLGISVNLNGKKASMLTIDSVNEEHSGNYSCVAVNSAGMDRYSAMLNVNGTHLIYDSLRSVFICILFFCSQKLCPFLYQINIICFYSFTSDISL